MTRLSLGGPYYNPYTSSPPATPAPRLEVELTIDSPKTDTEVRGPSNGVTVEVKGTWRVIAGNVAIKQVEVQFGTDADWIVAVETPGVGAVSWAASKLIKATGALMIGVRLMQT